MNAFIAGVNVSMLITKKNLVPTTALSSAIDYLLAYHQVIKLLTMFLLQPLILSASCGYKYHC